ncbi:RDD family protein [Microbacterium abyssi]|uniref:RDD family protein n=1 Tax=Microbacterium abyssi TaxID=2782166 RepID=UPI001887A6D4|nr:RDD family protein [Microbacterium sp. A18JL241]
MTHTSFGTVAPTSRRAVAYIIDAAIAAGIGIVLTTLVVVIAFASGPDGMLAALGFGLMIVWLLMVGWFVVYTVMQSGNGSIGMRAQGLRLVSEADGAALGFGRTLVRNIIFGLAASIVVGYFTPLFDGSGRFQGWHDKVAKSLMMDARTGPATVGTPPEQDVRVPPRPPLPHSAPPIPGLATPMAAPQAPAFPAVPAPAAPALDETVRGPEALRAAPAAPVAHPGTPETGGDSLIAFVPGITQDGPPARETPAPEPVAPAPAPASPAASAPAAAPAPIPASEPGEVSDIEDTRISIPGHRLVFTWDDGTRVTVSRRTLFGRNPSPEDGAVVVPVRDETLSLSKTHFEAAAEPSGGWIMDRHSTNGTIIMRDGHRISCEPGEQVRIRLGDAIEIGDRIVTVGGYA